MKFWKNEAVFHEGDQFFSELCKSIDEAKVSVELETYILEEDQLGLKIIDRLKEAAKRGVLVRLVVDGVGSYFLGSTFIQQLNREDIQAKVFRPMPRILLAFFSLHVVRRLARLNRRNHRKVCIIDKTIAYVGGMNISMVHLRQYSGAHAWRDTSVRVEGAEIHLLLDAFEIVWNRGKRSRIWRLELNKETNLLQDSSVKLNDSLFRRRDYSRELNCRIENAEDRVWITTPYFVPDFRFMRSIRIPAQKGKDVCILLPHKIDIKIMKWVNRSFYKLLLKAGVKIYEYQPTTLHAKVTMIDQWMTVGSSNRNQRSLLHDLEVDIVLTHPLSRTSLEEQFKRDLQVSRRVTLHDWERRPKIYFLFERFFLLFKRWL